MQLQCCKVSKESNLRLCSTEHLMCPVCKALFNGIYRICELSHTESQWTHYKKCVNSIISSTINLLNAQIFVRKTVLKVSTLQLLYDDILTKTCKISQTFNRLIYFNKIYTGNKKYFLLIFECYTLQNTTFYNGQSKVKSFEKNTMPSEILSIFP